MRQSYRLIYNAIVGWASTFAESAISFLLLPFLVHRLGTAGYGVFALAYSASMALDFVRVGLAGGLTKFVAGYAAEGRQDEINRTLGTVCAFSTVVGGVLGGGIIVLRGTIATILNVAPEYRPEFDLALTLMGVLVVGSFTLMGYLGILLGFQRHDLMRISQLIVRTLRAGLMVAWFVLISPSVVALAAITLICGVLLHVAWLLAAHRQWPWLRGSFLRFDRKRLVVLVSFSTIMVLIGGNYVLVQQASRWIVASMISVDFVTYLTVMITPAGFIYMMVQNLTLTIMPVASKYHASNDQRTLVNLLIRGTRYSFLITGACVAAFVPVMHPLLRVWMGPDFEHLAAPMIILVACAGLGASASCPHNLLKGMGRAGSVLACLTVSSIISLAVTVVAIKWFRATDWAIACGFSVYYLLMLILQSWLCVRVVGVRVRRFLRWCYLEPVVALAPTLVASSLITRWMGVNGLLPTALVGIGTATVFVLGFAWLFFSGEEWDLAQRIWREVKGRLLPST